MATGLHNVGYWGSGPTLALAIAFGGTAQFIAGIVDLRKGSIFGGSAFIPTARFGGRCSSSSTYKPRPVFCRDRMNCLASS
jgi:hypothetical protein